MKTETLPDSADASDQPVSSDVVSDKGMILNPGTNYSRRVPPFGASFRRSESAAGGGMQISSETELSCLIFPVSFTLKR